MVNFWYITGDFLEERKRRIGASDIPALIPDPEKPTETLAGYGRTPITVWREKTGRRERDPAGLPAEMGHYLEGKVAELFIRSITDYAEGLMFRRMKDSYELMNRDDGAVASGYQHGPFRHNTQFHRDGMIVHADVIYDPSEGYSGGKRRVHGVTVDLEKPFLIEAKSANYWAAKRPEGSFVRGYDVKLKTWQGIPLKHYMQTQFQMALLEIDVAYLPLIHNTSEFHVWQIRANKAHQAKLIDLAGKMVWHIENDKPPADLAMNTQDIIDLYPEIGDDFVIVDDDERSRAVELSTRYFEAKAQEKRWSAAKADALDAMAVMLRDRPEMRDREGILAKWQITRGSEKIKSLSAIKDDDPLAYRYLKRKGLLYTSKDSRRVVPYRKEKDE